MFYTFYTHFFLLLFDAYILHSILKQDQIKTVKELFAIKDPLDAGRSSLEADLWLLKYALL